MTDKALSEFLKQRSKKDLYGLIKDREKIIEEKDQRIAELENNYNRLNDSSFAIYCALADILEKENPEHVPSRIDQLTGEYLAKYADMWQGNKLKNNRIAELEEENVKLKKDYEFCHNDLRSKIDYIHDQDEVINYYKEENVKLQEQLKNAIVPKYHLDQYVYVIRWEKPYRTRIDVIKAILIDEKITIFYEYDAPGSYVHVEISEDGVFATEVEAQKYLEEK